jgi:restriction system protein
MAKRHRSNRRVEYGIKDDQGRIVHKFRIPAGLSEAQKMKAWAREIYKYTRPIAAEKRKELEALIDEAMAREANKPEISVSGIVIPEREGSEGTLIQSTSVAWLQIVRELGRDWRSAYEIPARTWEEIIAGAYKQAGFDEVVLTPRSADHGRDIIATRYGVGCIKIIGSIKAYKPGHLVNYDDIRSLIGVMAGERDTSKGIITTTSDFPPRIMSDPFIAPFVPYRLELMNGMQLRNWLKTLIGENDAPDNYTAT